MPYHVRISTKSKPRHDEVRLDLTKPELESRFLRPYREGRPITIGGKTVAISDLERMRITFTEQTADQILPLIRAERSRSTVLVVGGPSDEWHIANHGRDVTDELITEEPGSKPPRTRARSSERAIPRQRPDPRKLFVVHGRNEKARDAMFTFLRALDLDPIEWNEAVNATEDPNPSIPDVLKVAFATAQSVLVLMTPDDEGQLKDDFREPQDPPHETQLTPQARLNVIFEAGMAMAWDPKRTVLVELGTCRPFSDLGGRHLIHLNNSSTRRQELAQRLQIAGAAVKMTGTDWHNTGDFSTPS